ncbi:MAG: CDP-diacylglycerol--glycerol-3-phosphate 3-phosphatidyltransferase [Cohaesibacter sp.]|jgi:CDP-diacylglycerol--glycerol-3-phosphate 3-phosphatidyltransferase|nr:CDP-diacylglycerol--glycerol-3-phosphate 3-phosphatidyltransferase [Cohaesibacter sp.]
MKKSTTFSLPNILTFGRILAVPALVVCMLWPDSDTARWTALGIFAAAAITDFFDGYLARVMNVQSALGRMLDPIADKLLVSISILMLASTDTLRDWHLWAGVIILCREILVSGLREFLAELQVSVPVTRLAKWKTTAQLVALGFLLAGPAGDKVLPFNTEIGLILLWISAILTLYTGYDYFRAGIHHLLDD